MPELNVIALHKSGLLDSPPEVVFDRLTAFTSRVLKVPVALISLVDDHRQFFKSSCGLPAPYEARRETPLSHSFCQHVVASDEPLIVSDARTHPLVKDNLAIPDLGVIAYAGMPLRDEKGVCLGALCAIDGVPRDWTEEELATLSALAAQVSAEFALRAQAARLGHDIAAMQAAEEQRHQMARLDRHDLRTPLNALVLSLGAIGYSGPVTPEQAECLATARRNCDAVLRLVDHMLDISNIDHRGGGALECTVCRADDLIYLAIEQVFSLAKEHELQVGIADPAALPSVPADRDKIVRVLVNLLGNALKYSPAGSHITISASAGEGGVVFTVADDGPGIPAEDLQRIFHEGVRLDPGSSSRRSTGLGLTFCQRVVEAHNGRIWVQSQPGRGAQFSFLLPAI
ncbi:GAF domain-containing sensor histidine kinase [soil metagenome]